MDQNTAKNQLMKGRAMNFHVDAIGLNGAVYRSVVSGYAGYYEALAAARKEKPLGTRLRVRIVLDER
jgi:hypothetical protein